MTFKTTAVFFSPEICHCGLPPGLRTEGRPRGPPLPPLHSFGRASAPRCVTAPLECDVPFSGPVKLFVCILGLMGNSIPIFGPIKLFVGIRPLGQGVRRQPRTVRKRVTYLAPGKCALGSLASSKRECNFLGASPKENTNFILNQLGECSIGVWIRCGQNVTQMLILVPVKLWSPFYVGDLGDLSPKHNEPRLRNAPRPERIFLTCKWCLGR